MRLNFNIISWGAWSPLYQSAEDWQHWLTPIQAQPCSAEPPKLNNIPANQRRRLSPLTKILLEAAFQAKPPKQCRSIFASQHGEINRTLSLLTDITNKQSLSPTSFSQSVHNTASGIFSILTKNQAPSTAIAAGSMSLTQALIEAYGQLAENAAPLLLVYGDEPVPHVFNCFKTQPKWPIGMAFVLTKQDDLPHPARLAVQSSDNQGLNPLQYGDILKALACKTPCSGQLQNTHWDIHFD